MSGNRAENLPEGNSLAISPLGETHQIDPLGSLDKPIMPECTIPGPNTSSKVWRR